MKNMKRITEYYTLSDNEHIIWDSQIDMEDYEDDDMTDASMDTLNYMNTEDLEENILPEIERQLEDNVILIAGAYNSNYADFRPSGAGSVYLNGIDNLEEYMGNFDRACITSINGNLGIILADHDGTVAGTLYTMPKGKDKVEVLKAMGYEDRIKDFYDEVDIEERNTDDLMEEQFQEDLIYDGVDEEEFGTVVDKLVPVKDNISAYSTKKVENNNSNYWDTTEIKRDLAFALGRFNFGHDNYGNNYIITIDSYDVKRFHANSDEEAIQIYEVFKEDWKNTEHTRLDMDVDKIVENKSNKYNLNTKLKDYYKAENSDDKDMIKAFNKDNTFQDLKDALDNHIDVYSVIFKDDTGDSIVREILFTELAEILNVDYDVIYYKWLGEADISKFKNKKQKLESSEKEYNDFLTELENCETVEDIQDLIYTINDGALENSVQDIYDSCIKDKDDLDTIKSLVEEVYEDNAVLEESKSKSNSNNWCGVPGVKHIWHGEWNDPEIEYKGLVYNEWDVQDNLGEVFEEECRENGIEIETDLDWSNKFSDWCKANPEEVYSALEFINPKGVSNDVIDILNSAYDYKSLRSAIDKIKETTNIPEDVIKDLEDKFSNLSFEKDNYEDETERTEEIISELIKVLQNVYGQDNYLTESENNIDDEPEFDPIEFEKTIPHKMRFKSFDLLEENGRNILYWVTQEFFDDDELEQFVKSVKEYNKQHPNDVIDDILLIVRDNSGGYNYGYDKHSQDAYPINITDAK